MEEQQPRLMPILRPEQYNTKTQQGAVSAESKADFLKRYFESGNLSASCRLAGCPRTVIGEAMTNDPVFHSDFKATQDAMKHNLEQTMYQNGLKEKGYMDRITWLRKNYPKEYNPDYVEKNENPMEAIRELSSKLGDYELIPKSKIVDADKK